MGQWRPKFVVVVVSFVFMSWWSLASWAETPQQGHGRESYNKHPRLHDRDNNPPGPRGGVGTNWENPPGPRGGPGASPNRRPPFLRDRDNNPPGPRGGAGTNWENPPGPRGGLGASPDKHHGSRCRGHQKSGRSSST